MINDILIVQQTQEAQKIQEMELEQKLKLQEAIALNMVTVIQTANNHAISSAQNGSGVSGLGSSHKSASSVADSSPVDSDYANILSDLASGDPSKIAFALDKLADLYKTDKTAAQKIIDTIGQSRLNALIFMVFAFHSFDPSDKSYGQDFLNKYAALGIPEFSAAVSQINWQQFMDNTSEGGDYTKRCWKIPGQEPIRDLSMIGFLIFDGLKPNTINTQNPLDGFASDMKKLYRSYFLDQIDRFKNCIGMVLVLLAMMGNGSYGTQQQGDLAYQTKTLNSLINGESSPLLSLIQKAASFSADDAKQFIEILKVLNVVIPSTGSMTDMVDSFSKAYDGIRGLTLPGTGDPKANPPVPDMTIGQLMDKIDSSATSPADRQALCEKFAAGMQKLGTSQALINEGQSVGALFTGMSKSVSTNLEVVINTLNEVLKMAGAVGPDGSLSQLIKTAIQGQRAN